LIFSFEKFEFEVEATYDVASSKDNLKLFLRKK
jgi:hypothetical protein